MLEKIKSDLDANYNTDDETVLQDIIDDMTAIACNVSNRKSNDVKLEPYIKKAVKSAYQLRGDEGKTSSSEGSISSSYEDIEEKLRINIIKNGVRKVK